MPGYWHLVSDAGSWVDPIDYIKIEYEDYYAQAYYVQTWWPRVGDLAVAAGRWIVDCGHSPYWTEIHPPSILALMRTTTHNNRQATYAQVWVNGWYSGSPVELVIDHSVQVDAFASADALRINTEFEFGGIYLFRFNEDNSLKSIARAENSGIDDADNWILENFRETRFNDDSVQVIESSLAVESSDLDSETLGVTFVKPVSLSARGLLSYINYLKKNELTSGRYETEFWSRISTTVTVIIMPVLALGFVFGPMRAAGAGGRLLLGVLIGLAYFLASEMLANSGQVFELNPAIITWLPSISLLLITFVALSRVR